MLCSVVIEVRNPTTLKLIKSDRQMMAASDYQALKKNIERINKLIGDTIIFECFIV